MSKRIAAIAIVFGLALNALGDYEAQREAAVALYKAGKREEAVQACVKLAAQTQSIEQKTDALRLAALYADGLGDHDRAMRLAQQIPDEAVSKLTQMRIMNQRRKQLMLGSAKDLVLAAKGRSDYQIVVLTPVRRPTSRSC